MAVVAQPFSLSELGSLSFAQLINLSILTTYLLTVFGLFLYLLPALRPPKAAGDGWHVEGKDFNGQAWVWAVWTIVSFALTWTYMFKFLYHSYTTFNSSRAVASPHSFATVADWLVHTTLFLDAWETVSTGDLGWFWSLGVCGFTVAPWTAFLVLEGRRRAIPRLWAFLLLGQLCAISVATSLFFLAVSRHQRLPRRRILPASHLIAARIGTVLPTISVLLHPFLPSFSSLPPNAWAYNLALFHLLPFLPLLLPHPALDPYPGTPRHHESLYPIAPPYHALLLLRLLAEHRGALPAALWAHLNSHPARASIGWDVLCTAAAVLLWAGMERALGWRDIIASASGGVGGLAGSVFGRWEKAMSEREKREEKIGKGK